MALGRNPLLDKTNQSQSRVGSGFTNLQRVLDANKQNRLGQTLTTGVGNLAQQNKQAVGNAQSEFQTDAEAGRLDTAANTQFRNQALESARTGTAVSDQDAEHFQQLQQGQYAGPQNLRNIDALKDQANQVQEMGTYGSDANKTKGLLQKFVSSPRYSLGQKTLDATILGQDPNVAKGIRQQTVGVARGVDRASNAAGAQATELSNKARGYNQETQGLLANEATGYDAAMVQKAQEGTAARNALIEKAKQQLDSVGSSGTLSRDVADALGLKEGQELVTDASNPLYGEDSNGYGYRNPRKMSAYYSYNPLEADRQSIQSVDDYAKLQALKKLGGSSANADAQAAFNNYLDPSRVGQFAATPLADFSQDAYTGDIKRFHDYLNTQNYQNQINGLTDATKDIERTVFQNPQPSPTALSTQDILSRKASTLSTNINGGANQDVIDQLVQERLAQDPQYQMLNDRYGKKTAAAQKARADFLEEPAIKQALATGTVEDFLKAAGKDTTNLGQLAENLGERMGAAGSSDVLTLPENIATLSNRYGALQRLRDWSAGKKLKITD